MPTLWTNNPSRDGKAQNILSFHSFVLWCCRYYLSCRYCCRYYLSSSSSQLNILNKTMRIHYFFLDLSVSVEDGFVHRELFIKPCHSGVHLSYMSALSMNIKRSVAIKQFRRASKNASTEEGRKRGLMKIERLHYENNYPRGLVEYAKQRASFQQRGKREQWRDSL